MTGEAASVYNVAPSPRIVHRPTTIFSADFIEQCAEEPGGHTQRKHTETPVLAWSFVFGFGAGES